MTDALSRAVEVVGKGRAVEEKTKSTALAVLDDPIHIRMVRAIVEQSLSPMRAWCHAQGLVASDENMAACEEEVAGIVGMPAFQESLNSYRAAHGAGREILLDGRPFSLDLLVSEAYHTLENARRKGKGAQETAALNILSRLLLLKLKADAEGVREVMPTAAVVSIG